MRTLFKHMSTAVVYLMIPAANRISYEVGYHPMMIFTVGALSYAPSIRLVYE